MRKRVISTRKSTQLGCKLSNQREPWAEADQDNIDLSLLGLRLKASHIGTFFDLLVELFLGSLHNTYHNIKYKK